MLRMAFRMAFRMVLGTIWLVVLCAHIQFCILACLETLPFPSSVYTACTFCPFRCFVLVFIAVLKRIRATPHYDNSTSTCEWNNKFNLRNCHVSASSRSAVSASLSLWQSVANRIRWNNKTLLCRRVWGSSICEFGGRLETAKTDNIDFGYSPRDRDPVQILYEARPES